MAIGTGWRKQRQEIKKWPFEAGSKSLSMKKRGVSPVFVFSPNNSNNTLMDHNLIAIALLAGCQYKEQSYKEGQSWKVECNTCTCQNNEVACSKKICGKNSIQFVCYFVPH